MDFSGTMSDGIAELRKPDARGYAFYHRQDTNGARTSGNVNIAFGAYSKKKLTDKQVLAIGREVRDALVAAKLHVEWTENIEARPTVYPSLAAKEAQENAYRAQAAAFDAIEKDWLAAVASFGVDAKMIAGAAAGKWPWVANGAYYDDDKKVLAAIKKAEKAETPILMLPVDETRLDEYGLLNISIKGVPFGPKHKALLREVAAAMKKQGLAVITRSPWVRININGLKPKAKARATNKKG